MPDLTGGPERVDLGGGYGLVAPGLKGRAQRMTPGTAETRARESATPLLDDLFARTDIASVATIDITAAPVPGAAGATTLRDSRGDDALQLEVPDLGPEAGQVVLSVDEAGTLTWHFPQDGTAGIQPPSVRGTGARKRFVIRRDAPSVAPGSTGSDRALFGSLGRKLLKVLVYPISDALLGKPASMIAEHWETANRAYGLRDFSPANYREAPATSTAPGKLALDAAGVQRVAAGRALLFLHGTFSNAHGAFHDVPEALMRELHARYGGRVLALDHFSLSHDPVQNVRWLIDRLRALAPGTTLDVDIVCHSRGGLVARTLADGGTPFGIDTSNVRVRRIAFVGVPNKGTLLAQPDHMVTMIDRLTTGLNLVPPGGVADVLEGILIAVKVIGHGALKGLAGLRSMDPAGPFLQQLNAHGRKDPEWYAIAANYQPKDAGLHALVAGAANRIVDRIFAEAGNDLVVPEAGVYTADGVAGFPIADSRCLRLPTTAGVMHTSMFGNPDVASRLSSWLQ